MRSKYLLHTSAAIESFGSSNKVDPALIAMHEKTLDAGERRVNLVLSSTVGRLIDSVKNPESNIREVIDEIVKAEEEDQISFCLHLCEDVANHFSHSTTSHAHPEWVTRIANVFLEMPPHIVIGAVRSRIGFVNLARWGLNTIRYCNEWTFMLDYINNKFLENKSVEGWKNLREQYCIAVQDNYLKCTCHCSNH
jgi:hypothetical protein